MADWRRTGYHGLPEPAATQEYIRDKFSGAHTSEHIKTSRQAHFLYNYERTGGPNVAALTQRLAENPDWDREDLARAATDMDYKQDTPE